MPEASADPSLEAALDELYASDPAEFVAIRKRLASSLAAEGDAPAAKQLRAARRPSMSAWALNQLARREPQVVTELLERSADLVAAQTRALTGHPEAMRDAMHAHRDALDAATEAALTVLGARANDAFRSEIVSTLRAASSDDDVGLSLRSGRLVREVSSPGFPDATGLTLVPGPARPKPTKRTVPAARRASQPAPVEDAERDTERDADREREREARREADRAAREAADRAAAAADRDAAEARERIEQLQRDLELARHDLSAALARSRTAKKQADRLHRP